MEIACDESGHEGERLAGGVTDVFAHAAVALPAADAEACVAELRRRIRSPAREYKANHLLREKHRGVLAWFLGAEGPLPGRAAVLLVDKELLLVRSLVAALAPGGDADGLLAAGRRADPAAWAGWLAAADALLRG
ncbi:MAG: NAD-dependent protein deacetylase of SIR2 family, partial [Pseudonocardiales bacterium]|nr:NAD-dependent protein deacetylase of SIR2 family [Pseudonocardiales bacterium]